MKYLVLIVALIGMVSDVDGAAAAAAAGVNDLEGQEYNHELIKSGRGTYHEQLNYDRRCCKELLRAFSATEKNEEDESIPKCSVGRLPDHLQNLIEDYAFGKQFFVNIVVPKLLKNKDQQMFNSVPEYAKRAVISRLVQNEYDLKLYDENPMVLKGHGDEITCLCLDKHRDLCSGSFDNTIRVWDTNTGECKQLLEGHDGLVSCMCLDKHGDLCSGSSDNTIKVWDTRTGNCMITFDGHDNSVLCLFLDEKENLCSGSSDDTIRAWNVDTGKCENVFGESDSSTIHSCSDKYVKFCSEVNSNATLVFDPNAGMCRKVFIGHHDLVCRLCLDRSGNLCSVLNNSIRIWKFINLSIYWESLDQEMVDILQQLLLFDCDQEDIDKIMIELNKNDWLFQQPEWLKAIVLLASGDEKGKRQVIENEEKVAYFELIDRIQRG